MKNFGAIFKKFETLGISGWLSKALKGGSKNGLWGFHEHCQLCAVWCFSIVKKVQCFPQCLKQISDSYMMDSIVLFTSIRSLGMSLSPILLDCRVLPFFYHVTFLSLHVYMVLAQVPDPSRTSFLFVRLFVFPGNFGRSWWGRKREERRQKKNPSLSSLGYGTMLCNQSCEVLEGTTWTGKQQERCSRHAGRRWRQRRPQSSLLSYHWFCS